MKSTVSASSKVTKDPWAYFQPGQMIYIIKHETTLPPQTQLENLFSWSNKLAENLGLYIIPWEESPKGKEQDQGSNYSNKDGKNIKGDQEAPMILKEDEHLRPRVHSFSRKPELNPLPKKQIEHRADVNYKSPEVRAPTPFSLISVDVIDRRNKREFIKNDRLISLINTLDDNLRGLVENSNKPPLSDGVSLEAVIPNWLLSASSESGGTGGPGARPMPFYIPRQTVINEPDVLDFPFNVSQNFMALPGLRSQKDERGKGVKVAILDTAPGLHELAAAYERWQKVKPVPGAIRHKPIESLLRPNGPLTVHPASYNDLLRMRSVHLHEHNYNMTDHGLFVASIIHNIAPAAEIHLFEVLNADGVGDLESIAKGMWDVFNQFAGEPLVVNCSLVINIPLKGNQITDLDPQVLAKIVKNWETRATQPTDYLDVDSEEIDLDWLERQSLAIKWICDLLYAHGSKVIAAAGNDRREDGVRPNARYPAAFDNVLGVGSLPKDTAWENVPYTPASYSNISDQPGNVGVTTFGGEGGEGKGVLGLYIGEFPVDPNPRWWQRFLNWLITLLGGHVAGPPNLTNIAWWAGTSFAAPILTGTIAAVLGDIQPARTEEAVEEAYHKLLIRENQTDQEEDAIEVTQF